MRQLALRRFEPAVPVVAVVTLTWSLLLITTPDAQLAQVVSNVGLALIACIAGLAAVSRARGTSSIARF